MEIKLNSRLAISHFMQGNARKDVSFLAFPYDEYC